MTTTLFLIKPDAIQRGLAHAALKVIEVNHFALVAVRMLTSTPEEAQMHYYEHRHQPWFNDLIEFTCSGPMLAILAKHPNAIVAGRNVVKSVREQWRNPEDALMRNLLHASDSEDNALREARLWFPDIITTAEAATWL